MTITHNEIIEAIASLRPNAEWRLEGDDYSAIEWLSDGDAPTLAEIEKEVIELPKRREAEALAKATAKADLYAKLGLTEDEAKLLLG